MCLTLAKAVPSRAWGLPQAPAFKPAWLVLSSFHFLSLKSFHTFQRGTILILAIGNWSVAQGFKLDALQSNKIENTDNLNLNHHHEENNDDMKENTVTVHNESQSALPTPAPISNLVLDERVRTLAEGRSVAFGFKDKIEPIVVESPPPGINFTNCVVDDSNGYCCIDFVSISFSTFQI